MCHMNSTMPCPCESCSAAPAPTYTEAYRMACEARHVATMAHLAARQAYLNHIGVKRGTAAKAELERAVIQAWLSRKKKMGLAT